MATKLGKVMTCCERVQPFKSHDLKLVNKLGRDLTSRRRFMKQSDFVTDFLDFFVSSSFSSVF